MIGSALYTYILETFKRTDKSTEVYEAITDTVKDIKIRCPFEDLKYVTYVSPFTTVGDYKYAIPSDCGHLIGEVKLLDSGDSWVLEKISKEEYDRLEPNPTYASVDTGKPTHYCVYGGEFYFYPPTDSTAYQIEFNYSSEDETDITSATANVAYSTRYRECLKAGVLYRMYRDLGNDEETKKWVAVYENEIGKIILREKRLTEPGFCMKPREV